MFRTIKDFRSAWKHETEMTGKIFANLTDASLEKKVTEDGRALGFIGWHLLQTYSEMLGLVGLKIDAPGPESDCPSRASEIAAAHEKAARSVADEISANWTDDTLLITDNMYGETWPRGVTLFLLITHEAHHRGQMTILMRQFGLPVPGVYGPSKEEWAAMGAPAMK